LKEMDQTEAALQCYDTAISLDKNSSHLWNGRGCLLVRDLDQMEEGLKCYNMAIKLKKKNATAWQNKAYVLRDLGRDEEALECVNEALRLGSKKKTKALWTKGGLLLDLGRFWEAIQNFDEVIKSQDETYLEVSFERKMEALEKMRRDMDEKKEECLEMLRMTRKVFLVMREVKIPPEIRWMIVMKGNERNENGKKCGELEWEEKKKVVLFGSDLKRLGETMDEFWNHLPFSPQLDYLAKKKRGVVNKN